MKKMKLRKIAALLVVVGGLCSFLAGCTDEINNYEKETPAEATNKVFISEQYASLAFTAQRTVEGEVANMDTLIAKVVVNCTSPAGGELKVKVVIDTLLAEVYNKKNETSYRRFQSNWIRLSKSTLTIPEGSTESSDTLIVALTRSLDLFTSLDGYIMPVRITSASGYDAQVDYGKRVSYLTLDVTQENGVGFEEGKNSLMVAGNSAFTGCDLPMMAYIASANDINVGLEVDNSLVAAFNSQYGTDFKTLPVSDWELSDVSLPAGTTSAMGHITYKGDASQFAGDNYLVPIKIKSVTSPGATEPIKTMRTDVYYLVVNSAADGYTLEANDAAFDGVQVEDRSAYKAISDEYKFTVGSWESMFGGNMWVLDVPASVTIDLGREVSNITGIYLRANNSSMSPASMDLSYAGEEMYDATGLSVNLGSIELPRSCEHMYFKFAKPVTARYLGLNNMVAKSVFYSCKNFYIYTQNE